LFVGGFNEAADKPKGEKKMQTFFETVNYSCTRSLKS